MNDNSKHCLYLWGYENWIRLSNVKKEKQRPIGVLQEIYMRCVIFGRRKDGKGKLLRSDHVWA
jgi:hypothetical protein